ncbi:MAG: mycoredoxin [Dehalococcoidia bacterium]|nr:mycoredoxin [Dehalococcoidia bacterium]
MASNSITVYGTAWCGDCQRAKRVLDGKGVSYTWIDIGADPGAAAEVMRMNGGMRSVPTILFPDGSVLVEPSDSQLRAKIETVVK